MLEESVPQLELVGASSVLPAVGKEEFPIDRENNLVCNYKMKLVTIRMNNRIESVQ